MHLSQQLVPVRSINWDWRPWWLERSRTAASPNWPPVPTHILHCIEMCFTFSLTHVFLPFPPSCLLQRTDLETSPRGPRRAQSWRCTQGNSQAWLTSALTKLNKNELWRILIFKALDEKDSFKAFKRFSPLRSSFQRSVLCSLNRRHVLKLLPSFIKLASDLQMQLCLIESCNIYLPSCDIWNCARYTYWGEREVTGKAWGDGGRKPLLL